MLLDRDQVIGGLRMLKEPFRKDPEILDILESAAFYLKADAPVECEEADVYDEETGRLLYRARYCGKCTHMLTEKDFCPHCGKQVKRSGKRWREQE